MIYLKTKEEIELLRQCNQLVSRTLALVGRNIRPGVTTLELDALAEEYIRAHGAVPNFKGYGGFPATLCMSVNEQIVHGIPSGYALQEGDILSVDCGAYMNGFHGDSAYTFAVGEVDPRTRELLDVTKEALYRGVAQAKADYAAAYEYFKSGDFVMAGRYFDKVRETDRNNFFAEYYYRLSDIRRKRQEGKLCGAEFVIALLMEPVEKMKAACQPISVKRGFLLHAFSEAESLLNALYDTIGVIYGSSGDIDSARKEYLIMGRDCRRLTMIDREAAMLDDSEVSGHVISICEIAVF